MYIQESKELSRALRPIVKDRVLVRYSVSGWGQVSYRAELIVLSVVGGEEFFYQARISLFVARGITQIESVFEATAQPDFLEDLARGWLGRSADDWCYGEQYMGGYEIYRDGQLLTSIKLQPHDPRWHLLAGVILGELRTHQEAVSPENVIETHCIKLMNKRFSGFAAENISVWADQALSAH